jgi:hypothetical protein
MLLWLCEKRELLRLSLWIGTESDITTNDKYLFYPVVMTVAIRDFLLSIAYIHRFRFR